MFRYNMNNLNSDFENALISQVSNHLVGKKITAVSLQTPTDLNDLCWSEKAIILHLDDGTCIWPSRDSEGNDAGSLFTNIKNLEIIPSV